MEGIDIATADGELLEQGALTVVSPGAMAELSKAEIAQQVATARQYPRSISRAVKQITSLATLDEQAAQECIYALPRGGKPIRGPSIRLAEIVAQQWGNNRIATRIVDVDRKEKVIVAEAVFHDLETNAAIRTEVRRRISDRQGRLLNDDMIVVTGNAASSIARRNAIFASVPKAVWNRAYEAAERIIKGDAKTLAERRYKAVAAFGTWGVKPEQIFAALGVAGEDEITLEHLPTLIGMFNAIRNGDETVESVFAGRAAIGGRTFDRVPDPLSDDGPKPEGDAAPAAAAGEGVDAGLDTSTDRGGEGDVTDDSGGFPSDEALRAMEREPGRGRRGASREG